MSLEKPKTSDTDLQANLLPVHMLEKIADTQLSVGKCVTNSQHFQLGEDGF